MRVAPMVKVTAQRRAGFTHDIEIEGGHSMVIDEPEKDGGADEGPSPARTLAAALASCSAITIEMYADRKGWDLGDVRVDVEMEFADHSVPRSFDVNIRVAGDLNDEQVERLRVIAGKCPVHRVLTGDRKVTVTDRVELVQ
jgi:putative redox protein